MKFRRVVFWTHLVVGLVLGLVILNMALSGAVLAYQAQIEAWLDRDLRQVSLDAKAPQLPLSALVAAAQRAAPEEKLTGAVVRADAASSVALQFGREKILYLHPQTAAVLGGESKTHEFFDAVEDWHRSLSSKKLGKSITGAACLTFGFLLLSGLFLWWPKQWNAAVLSTSMFFKSNLQGRARFWNWHNVAGFWLSPLILVTVTTGLVMAYPWANRLLFRAAGSEPPSMNRENRPSAEKFSGEIPWDQFLPQIAEKAPGWLSVTFRLNGGMATAFVEEPSEFGPNRRSQMTFKISSGDVKWEPFAEQSRGRQWRYWAKFLHTGEAFGLVGQSLALLGALGSVFLVFTGIILATYRFLR